MKYSSLLNNIINLLSHIKHDHITHVSGHMCCCSGNPKAMGPY